MTKKIGCLVGLAAFFVSQFWFPGIAAADNVRDAQWHLSFLNISSAQMLSRGDGIAVAVIDTGVDASHPDLGDSVGYGLEVGAAGDGRSDADGHGTAMAGLVAAKGTSASSGALGIAPDSMVIPIRIRDQGPLSVADAIDKAITKGVRVVCLALTTSDDPELAKAIRRARAADIVIVAGAGNRPDVGIQVPASYEGVVAAVGVDQNGNHADISVSGTEAMIAAPAVDIVSTAPGGKYSRTTGTSPATAIVAGVVALIRSSFPDLEAAEVIHRMTATAIDKGSPGRDKNFGFGVINPVAALTANVPSPPGRSSLSSSPTRAVGESGSTSGKGAGPVLGFVALLLGLAFVGITVAVLGRRAGR